MHFTRPSSTHHQLTSTIQSMNVTGNCFHHSNCDNTKPTRHNTVVPPQKHTFYENRTFEIFAGSSSCQMPCLEQTSAIMILYLSLSSVIRSKAMLSLLFPVTKEPNVNKRMLRLSWKEKRTNESKLEETNQERSLINTIRKRQLKFLGHMCRHKGLEFVTLTGKIEGTRSL